MPGPHDARFRGVAARRGARRLLVGGLAAMVLGCAGSGRPREHAGRVPLDHPRVALLPFDNLSGREEQERLFTETFLATLAGTGSCEVVDLGRVESFLEKQRIRATSSLSPEQMAAIRDSLHVRYVMLGTVLEAGTLRSQEGETPTAGASLRLVETTSGRIEWARVRVLAGDDRETIFGWGREQSGKRLLTRLADEMLREFRKAGETWRDRATPGEVAK